METKSLKGKIALVAGATRGGGRGIACMLGEAGATVYCTGRSVKGQLASGAARKETIEETAALVNQHGGVGHWMQVDHTEAAQVQALFDQIEAAHGGLDILVNDVWGGDALTEWGKSFWELEPEKGKLMMERAVQAHVLTSRYGLPLMLDQPGGLIIEVTDGDAHLNRAYRGNLFYDLAKVSAHRLAQSMAYELRDTPHTAVSITPGFMRSEAVLEHFGVKEENWQEAVAKDPHFAISETPFFVGRAIAALAADPLARCKSGQSLSSWGLAREYGFTDIDGRQPDWGRHVEKHEEAFWANLSEVLAKGSVNARLDRADMCIRAALPQGTLFSYPLSYLDVFFAKPEVVVRGFAKAHRQSRPGFQAGPTSAA